MLSDPVASDLKDLKNLENFEVNCRNISIIG